ncbi:MAG: thiol oxidoreductase-like protein [Gammaproteobacteria bacterium]|nr:MAG: thiol oxidoreductase-like protein [Gammaproteobacteria bacterium]
MRRGLNMYLSAHFLQSVRGCVFNFQLTKILPFIILLLGFEFVQDVQAELVPCDKVDAGTVNAPGGCIAKRLDEQIGNGHGDKNTAGSAVYLVKRDPARSIRRGRQLFQRKFSTDEGLGPRVNASSTGDITQNRALGAGLTDSCAACHGRPRGSAGFGGDVNTRPDSRDAPHLFGLGIVEQLAEEMTQRLRNRRARALEVAEQQNRCITTPLRAKRVSFGMITACPNGKIDTSEVKGVDEDLRIRPFFHQGGTVSIREFIIGAFKDEMGLQAWDPVLCAVTDPENPQAVVSPSGFAYDPAQDTFERPAVCDASDDTDNDGVVSEIDPALIDHMEFYLLNYFKPGQYQVTQQAERGRNLLKEIGCTSCHKPNLRINSDRRVADVETVYDPERGIFNQLFATATELFTLEDDGNEYPLLLPKGEPFIVKNFYSDLKRHDLGPAFHERDFDGSVVTEFVTEPLWGVGSTAPYGHDGRSINLDAVIKRHGGEAAESRDAYLNLSVRGQRRILAFLETLVLFPPDDTASNLNAGNVNDLETIQSPDTHGSINLGALFQIDGEGAE